MPLSPEKKIKTKLDARVGAYRVFTLALFFFYCECFPRRRRYYHEGIMEEKKEEENES